MELRNMTFLKGGAATMYKFDWCSGYRRNFRVKIMSNKLISNAYNSVMAIAKRMRIDKALQA